MEIHATELKERLEQGEDLVLIDVREPYEHEEFNIGGENLPLGEIQNWISQLENQKESECVVYCRSGNRSLMAVNFMQMNGFSKVLNLTGGVLAWTEANNT